MFNCTFLAAVFFFFLSLYLVLYLSLYLVLFLYFSIHFPPPSLSKSLASSPTLSFPVNCFTPSVFNPTSFSQSLSFNFYIYILVFLPLYQSFLCHFFIISFFQPLSIYLIIYFIKTTVDGPVLAFTWLFFIGRLGGEREGLLAGFFFFFRNSKILIFASDPRPVFWEPNNLAFGFV